MNTRSLRVHGLVCSIALLLVIASLRIPVRIDSHEELGRVQLGLPFHFIEQNQGQYDPPFPSLTYFRSPWESPPHIVWLSFFLSWVVVFIAFDTLFVLFTRKQAEKGKGDS